MLVLPPEHPLRALLSDEVHARPPPALPTPSRITHVSLLIDKDAREKEIHHIGELCKSFAVAGPGPQGSQFSARLGDLSFTWERHGEFSGYTFALAGTGEESAASLLPAGWLSASPGQTLVAIDAVLLREPEGGLSPEFLARHFGANIVMGAEIAGEAGIALTDFRIHPDGYSRIVLLDRSLTERQAGRSLQRLFEVEVYRMLALLALPIAQRQLGEVTAIEDALASLARDISAGTVDDEALLQHINGIGGPRRERDRRQPVSLRCLSCLCRSRPDADRRNARTQSRRHANDRPVHGAPIQAGGGDLCHGRATPA